MTSAWKGPSNPDGRPGTGGGESEENQLDLFEILPRAGIRRKPPPAAGADEIRSPVELRLAETAFVAPPVVDHIHPETPPRDIAGPGNVETIVGPAATRDFLDVGVTESRDLRRLEDSIRWLMNAGTPPPPRTVTAPLPSMTDLSPPERHDDDTALLLDPDILFPPRAPRRASPIASGAAKVLLVSAIAAPTAYLVASWLQFPGVAAPSDPAAVAAVAVPLPLTGDRVAAAMPPEPSVPAAALPAPSSTQAAHDSIEVATASRPEPAMPRPTSRAAADMVMVASVTGLATSSKAVAEPPPVVAAATAQSGDPVSAPMPAAVPVKPRLRQEEIAMMVERGRVLFEAGDLAAARLFFRRAANAGDAAAAIAMGATYDPEVLTQRFIRGIEADAQEAQRWYERARDMGQRVEMLAQRR